ncbi:MAG: hypothetical protein PHQ05_10085 [Sterolibacterium sp.]|nr:hypothetical protein [Sterolibacterium sp.]
MGKYIVLSPIKSRGQLREVGAVVDLDDDIAAALRPGLVRAVAELDGDAVEAAEKVPASKPAAKPASRKKK